MGSEESLSDREEEDSHMVRPAHNEVSSNKRGRPVGKIDSTQRYRRTAQEISNDKINIAQMKLNAMKEKEALKLANKKQGGRPPAVSIEKRKEVALIKKERRPPVRQQEKWKRER